jgi:hypothetical protein
VIYTNKDLENPIEINGVKYVRDKFDPVEAYEELLQDSPHLRRQFYYWIEMLPV